MKGRDHLREEIEGGGKETPCPFCKVPRLRRSDYIRCCRCGINWLDGEPLDLDPRNARQRRMIDDMLAMAPPTKKREDK